MLTRTGCAELGVACSESEWKRAYYKSCLRERGTKHRKQRSEPLSGQATMIGFDFGCCGMIRGC